MSIWTKRVPTSFGNEEKFTRVFWGAVAAAVLFIIFLLGYWFVYVNTHQSIEQDSVAVTRGAGPIDKDRKKVKDGPLGPGRIKHNIFDTIWTFPSAQTVRFQNFDVAATTKDGKTVVISGNLGFRFGAKEGPVVAGKKTWIEDGPTVIAFAKGVGARQYGKDRVRPGEGIDAFAAFLDVFVVPELLSTVKQQIGGVYCADFEPACRVIDPRPSVPETKPDDVYEPLSVAIQDRVETKLGGPYLTDFRLVVKQIQLTENVRENIEALASEQAKTKAAEQAERTAAAEARAIRIKGRALQGNKSLVGVEIVKACGGNCTVIVDGSGRGAVVAAPTK